MTAISDRTLPRIDDLIISQLAFAFLIKKTKKSEYTVIILLELRITYLAAVTE